MKRAGTFQPIKKARPLSQNNKKNGETNNNMWILLLVVAGMVTTAAAAATNKCTKKDLAIWKREGHTWSHKFRQFGGIWVYQPAFEEKVRSATGLSAECARCYGDAYTCGYDQCKWSCMSEGSSCDSCLVQQKCTENCNKCTGFF